VSEKKNLPSRLFAVRNRPLLWAVLLPALLLRVAATWHWQAELQRDRDAYLAIARNIVSGHGFSLDGRHPTAYRPPLYPLVLAAAQATGGEITVATFQILLGVGIVLLTYLLGCRLLGEQPALIAAGVVAVDPLLLRYTPQFMTETLFTCLVTGLMWLSLRLVRETVKSGEPGASATGDGHTPPRQVRQVAAAGHRWLLGGTVGLVFGLCALTRPTIWAWGGVTAVVWIAGGLREPMRLKRRMFGVGIVVAAAMLSVSPWIIRNTLVFGRPIVTTTHGGYTLLLGNNPVFYNDVARQPWGTVWKGESFQNWQQSVEERMKHADPPPQTELQRDRWMFRRAMQNIAGDPGGFLTACWLRLRRFWNVVPLRASGGGLPAGVTGVVGVFYTLVMLVALVGVIRLKRSEWAHWWPLVLLMVSFTAVHLVYWSNTRMRAPLIPVVALLAVRGLLGKQHAAAG